MAVTEPAIFGWPQVWIVSSIYGGNIATILLVASAEEMANDFVSALNMADSEDSYRYVIERKPVMR